MPGTTAITNNEGLSQVSQENKQIVLIVEDNFELRNYIVSNLSSTYKILEAENGIVGYKIALKQVPDLIVCDIMMPKMTGIELCKKIKEEITTCHIPVILLTAKIKMEDRIEGIETGADVYITKPFNTRFLEVTIKNLIDTRQKLFRRFKQDVFILPKELRNNSLDQKFLERTIEFIEKNISNENLTVEDLASQILLSHSQTYRKIKALTGQKVTEFIRTIRLKASVKLMEEGKFNVSEICFKVGFTSPSYFTKCFKEQFGKAPTEFLSESQISK
jgi:YesN/AraC family two-component response regulator